MSYLKNKKESRRGGFTLLEMLLVIAIIAILASIVIVAINPAKQIGDANNAQRYSDVLAILNAVHQYQIDNSGVLSALDGGVGLPTSGTCGESSTAICDGDDCGEVNLHALLVDVDATSYLSAIPIDPLAVSSGSSTDDHSGYGIVQDSTSNRITVCAPLAENSETISITR